MAKNSKGAEIKAEINPKKAKNRAKGLWKLKELNCPIKLDKAKAMMATKKRMTATLKCLFTNFITYPYIFLI
mgnify:CR=1 FL=1